MQMENFHDPLVIHRKLLRICSLSVNLWLKHFVGQLSQSEFMKMFSAVYDLYYMVDYICTTL